MREPLSDYCEACDAPHLADSIECPRWLQTRLDVARVLEAVCAEEVVEVVRDDVTGPLERWPRVGAM